MNKNTPVSLGGYFERFFEDNVANGRYKNASEVIRAGLRLLEEDENRALLLRNSIREGLDSGTALNFNPAKHLHDLKSIRKENS